VNISRRGEQGACRNLYFFKQRQLENVKKRKHNSAKDPVKQDKLLQKCNCRRHAKRFQFKCGRCP
ncbi:unnamed protein product, partial [Candidula unifasciata]